MVNKISSIKERVLTIAKEKGISYERFCEGIGMTYGSFKGDQKKTSLNSDAIARIMTKYPDVDLNWLITGEKDLSSRVNQPLFNYGQKKFIPLLSIDSIADYQSNTIHAEEIELANYTVPVFEEIGVEYIIKVVGSSMAPLYFNGDLIGCKSALDLSFIQWGKPYVLQTKQGFVFNRLFPDDKNSEQIICRSEDGQVFPSFTINKADVLSASLVLGIIRVH